LVKPRLLVGEEATPAELCPGVCNASHRPPADGIRQVFALSRADAERLPLLASIAVISITAPESPLANIGGFAHVLRLSFADVDFLNSDISQKARG